MLHATRRTFILLLALTLVIGPVLGAGAFAAVTAPSHTDMPGHWAAELVAAWTAQGLIKGYPDGTFGPSRTISRAELCALLNRALSLSATGTGTGTDTAPSLPADVDPDAWYVADILTAIAAGYIKPDSAGRVDPDGAPSREEMSLMLALALGLNLTDDVAPDTLEGFTDSAAIGNAYLRAVTELVARGYMNGYPDSTLRPEGTIIRAEAVTLLARAMGAIHDQPGQYGAAQDRGLYEGSITITTGGVVLRNLYLHGDLHLLASSGVIRLENLVVYGTITIAGAAEIELHDVYVNTVSITRPGVTMVAGGNTIVNHTRMLAGDATLTETDSDGHVRYIIVSADADPAVQQDEVTLAGRFGRVNALRGARGITLQPGTVADQLLVLSSAAGSVIDVQAGAKIIELITWAQADITGEGAIERAVAMASGITIETTPAAIAVAPEVTAQIGGTQYAGQTAGVFEWSFDSGLEGWTGGFTDLPVDYEEDIYELGFGHSELPAEIGPGYGLFIRGHNRSDDLFMFVKRALGAAEGILPGTTYAVTIEIDLATNAPAGAVGIGGAPGESLFVKVGAAPIEPIAVPDREGPDAYYVLNVDKGAQNDEGRNAVQVGDGAKTSDDWDWSYEIKTMSNADRPLLITPDQDGQLWVLAGTDSGFEGLSELYYARIKVTLTTTTVVE